MLVKPDFSEIKEEVTPGTYKTIVKSGKTGEWPNGGTYVNWELETFGESEAKNNGRRIFYKTAVSGKGAFLLQKFYKAATNTILTGAFDTEQLVGKQLQVTVADGVNYKTKEPTGYLDVTEVKALT